MDLYVFIQPMTTPHLLVYIYMSTCDLLPPLTAPSALPNVGWWCHRWWERGNILQHLSHLQVVGALVAGWAGKEPLMHWSFPKQDAVAFLLPDTAAAVTA
jgi:hypothetical protein